MATVLRLKRKASNEPVNGLMVAVKKSKYEESDEKNQVLFKFAATLKSEKESVRDHIQAALSKEKKDSFSHYRDPKNTAVRQKSTHDICDKLKKETKVVSQKKKSDFLNNRRLVFAESVPLEENEESASHNAEVCKLFQLYDIIEENEDVKMLQSKESSTITCNGEPLIKEKSDDYVYDVYIADGDVDDCFMRSTISLRPCALTEDDIYSGDSSESEECYEDEDDSNDENNWRNEYPDESESDRDELDDYEAGIYRNEIVESLDRFNIDADEDSDSRGEPFDYSRILKELHEESDNELEET